MKKKGFLKSDYKSLKIVHNSLDYSDYAPYNVFHYIDTTVLLENIPPVKFITTSGTRVFYFP